MPIASQGWAFVSGSNPAGGSSGSIQFNIDDELSGSTDLIWDGSQVLITGSLSASNKVTALTFHGDGSGLTNVTASAVAVADGPEMSIQFRYDSPIGREISGSSDLMWITGSTDFLQVTGAVRIEGDLNVCAGTASIAHLSGCSDINVRSGMLFSGSEKLQFYTTNRHIYADHTGNDLYMVNDDGDISIQTVGDNINWKGAGGTTVGQMGLNEGSTKWKFKDSSGVEIMVIDGAASALTASTNLYVSGNLNVCAGTASIAHLSGCSSINVHSPMSSSQNISASAYYFGNGNSSYLQESPTDVEFNTGLGMFITANGGNLTLQGQVAIDTAGVLSSSTHISASAFVVPDGHNIGNTTKPGLMYLQAGTLQVDGDIEAGSGPGNETVRLRASGEVSGSGPAYFGSIQTSGSVTLDGGLLSSSYNISASAFYGDGAGITGISLINLDAAGSDTNVQFNQNGEFGASAGLIYDGTGSVTVSGAVGTSEYIADYGAPFQVTESYGGKLTLGGYGNPYLRAQQYYATSSLAEMEIGPFNRLAIGHSGQILLSSSQVYDPETEMPSGINLVCNPGKGIVEIETNRVSFLHNTASLSSDELEYMWSINSDHTGEEDESAWIKLDMDSKEFVVGAADNIKLVAQDIAASSLTASGRITSNDVRTAGNTIVMGGDIFGIGANLDGLMAIMSSSVMTGFGEIKSGIVVYGTPNPSGDRSVVIDVDGLSLNGGTSSMHYHNCASDTPDGANSYLAINAQGKVIKSAVTTTPPGSDGQLLFNQNGSMSANSQYTVDGSGSMTIGSGGGTLTVRNILDVPTISSSFAPGKNGQAWKLGFGDGSEGGEDSGGALSMFTSTSAGVTEGYLAVFTADSASYTDGGGSNNYKRVQINKAMRVQGDLQVGSINNHDSASLNTVNWKLKENENRALAFFTGSGGDSKDFLAFSSSAEHPAVTVGVPFRLTKVDAGSAASANHYLVLNTADEVVRTSAGGGSVAGSNKQVQFNQNGAFGANSSFTYNGSGSLELGAAINIAGASNLTVNNITNNGSNNQIWTLRDDIDGLSPGGNNGALMFFTGSGTDFMKFHTSGSAKGVVFGQQTFLTQGGSLSGTLAGPGSFLALDSKNMVILATPSGGGGGGAAVFAEIDGAKAYTTSSVSIGTNGNPAATLYVSSSGDANLFRVDGDVPEENPILYVTGSGFVGIGTDAPIAPLHITGALDPALLIEDGNIHLSGTTAAHNPEIQFIGNGGIGIEGLRIRYNNGTGNSHFENIYDSPSVGLHFTTRGQYDSGDNALSLVAGKAGIGTTSPSVSLDVHYTGSGDPINLDDDTGGGEVVYFGTASAGLTVGGVYYLNAAGGWESANSANTGSGHNQLLGIAMGAKPADNGVLIKGYFHEDSYFSGSFIKGGPLYIQSSSVGRGPTEGGYVSGAAPTAADSYVRVVGYGTDTPNVIYFNPDSTYIELG